jgi:hypothetical protein
VSDFVRRFLMDFALPEGVIYAVWLLKAAHLYR